MIDLSSHGSLQMLAPAALDKTATAAACTPDVLDLSDDLEELKYLIEDLRQTPAVDLITDSDDGWLATKLQQSTHALQARYRRLVESLKSTSSMRTSESTLSLEFTNIRREYLSIKNSVRSAYRQRGTLLCLSDWQSPTYSSSCDLRQNRLNDGIKEHVLDYKRDGHLDAKLYEEQFVSEYASHLGSSKLRAYLTNCGMAAFSTTLHWVAHELGLTRVISVEPMYFENLHLLQGYFSDCTSITPGSGQSLLSALQVYAPEVVFVDAVTNCEAVVSHEFTTILNWAGNSSQSGNKVIVVDTTCLPVSLLETGLLEGLPDNVIVIMVESLAKYHQFGMDAVTGGVLLLHASEALHSSFSKTRARHGTNIADSSVGCLPRPNAEVLNRRLLRHSRNLSTVAEMLETAVTSGMCGVIGSVGWTKGDVRHNRFGGSCLSLRLRPEFRTIRHYQEFEAIALDLARKHDLPLALSTSFGFDISRLYVTAPATAYEPPFLRVSIGTETTSQIRLFSRVLMQASLLCQTKWRKEPGEIIDDFQAPQIKPTKKRLPTSTFQGADALQRYLSPAHYASPPLVELPEDLNPFATDGIRIFAKVMPLVPLMNIKSVPAYAMLQGAYIRGELDGVENLIESSSSNTVLSLSVLSKLFGIKKTHAIVDHSLPSGLERMLRLFGIEIFKHPAAGHALFGKLLPRSDRAKQMGAQPGWTNPGQYSNPDNPDGFGRWLAPDLWNQTAGQLTILSCALGTCGTMTGVTRELRRRNPELEVVACCPGSGQIIPGPRELSLLGDVSFDWQHLANVQYELPARESFEASVQLLRRGIMAGPSSGMNYAGLIRYLQHKKDSGLLQNSGGDTWCVFLCCDSPLPHIDEYFHVLDDSFFPTVHDVPNHASPD